MPDSSSVSAAASSPASVSSSVANRSDDSRIPVTVLTGFLGAGKTTLLNRVLHENHGKKIAVIENEFGEVGVDNQLVIQSDEEIFEMNNGCICCTVRGDLIRILGRLLKRKDRLDAILIETTGMANPAPVAQTFFTDEEMREKFRLDAIVTVVDSKHILEHLGREDEAQKQVAFADVILLNKADLVAPADLGALEARLRGINTLAKLHRTQNCDLPLAHVLNVGGFNLSRATELDPKFLEVEYPFEWAGAYALEAGTHELAVGHCDHGEAHSHDADHETCDDDTHAHGHSHDSHEKEHHAHAHGDDHEHSEHAHSEHHQHHHGDENELDVVVLPLVAVAAPGQRAADHAPTAAAIEVAVASFSDWETILKEGEAILPGTSLQRLSLHEGHGHFPLKIAKTGHYLVFERHGEIPLHIYKKHGASRSDSDESESGSTGGERDAARRLVKPVWSQDFHAAHTHSDAVSSVGITAAGELDGKRLNEWISELLRTKGGDIYRMKGVLAVKGTDKRLVFQGVHMLFDAKFDRAWASDEARQNTLVFIGRNLDRAALTADFHACLA